MAYSNHKKQYEKNHVNHINWHEILRFLIILCIGNQCYLPGREYANLTYYIYHLFPISCGNI